MIYLSWIQNAGMEWILWTRTLQTTMQPVSGKFLKATKISHYFIFMPIVHLNLIAFAFLDIFLILAGSQQLWKPMQLLLPQRPLASCSVSMRLWRTPGLTLKPGSKTLNLDQLFCYLSCYMSKALTNFSQVRTGCGPDGRRNARRYGQRQGKTNVKPTKTEPALISACLVS